VTTGQSHLLRRGGTVEEKRKIRGVGGKASYLGAVAQVQTPQQGKKKKGEETLPTIVRRSRGVTSLLAHARGWKKQTILILELGVT